MLLLIDPLLDADDVARLRDTLAEATFSDGRRTAGAAARAVKHNQQAAGPAADAAAAFVKAALERHETVMAAARPAAFGPILASRYRPGMAYGAHVDNAFIGGVRADLAFTLFLSDPSDYDGGALRLHLPAGDQCVRPAAGALVLYPATSLHAVDPVAKGERLAMVGWIESRVRHAEAREALFDIACVRAALDGGRADVDTRLRLQKAEANLLRLLSG